MWGVVYGTPHAQQWGISILADFRLIGYKLSCCGSLCFDLLLEKNVLVIG